MAVKFGRSYVLEIETQNGEILTIKPPFTVEFDITRNTLTSANVCSIRIYNISKNNQNQIRKDVTDTWDVRTITFSAGYGANLPVVFSGNISQAWSVREGVNFITQIESFDGGFAFATGQTNITFPAGTAFQTIIQTLAASLPDLTVGAIGSFPGNLSRGNAYVGNTIDILRQLTGGAVFIDNGKVNILNDSDVLAGELLIINASSGLLGTPIREQTIINFDMLFEPRLTVGQMVQLQSTTAANNIQNQVYKIISLKHRGMISNAVCGDAITSVGMFYGTEALTEIPE